MQASSIGDLKCGKEQLFPRTVELVALLDAEAPVSQDSAPSLQEDTAGRTWREYLSGLRSMGFVSIQDGLISLSPAGQKFSRDPSRDRLADQFANRIRLFAEALAVLSEGPKTINEINEHLVQSYSLSTWKTVANTRTRMTWLEVLGYVEWLSGNKLQVTGEGIDALARWELVTPEAIQLREEEPAVANILPAPASIEALLDKLTRDPRAHESRNTYNIWVPSPASSPNKIANMRICIEATAEPIEKEDLLSFIADTFGLKRSSVESMMPFMRAAGLIQEIRRGVYSATPAARAWLETGSDLDYVRIIHAHMRYVGEILRVAAPEALRSEVYAQGSQYGMNRDKVRWILNFLVEAGLIVDISWSTIASTALGKAFAASLPLAPPNADEPLNPASQSSFAGLEDDSAEGITDSNSESLLIAQHLRRYAVDPFAEGVASGAAFENAIEAAFGALGFRSQRISGSGDTDVLVQWYDEDGQLCTAIIDAKSSASGSISHTNVSDVAIASHKEKHSADRVAIVAPGFSGETIRATGAKRGWALLTADDLAGVLETAVDLGLTPVETSIMFDSSDGFSRLTELIDGRKRQLDLISLVVARLWSESENDEPFSPRDISLVERKSDLEPTVDELVGVVSRLNALDSRVLRTVEASSDPKHETYRVGDVQAVARQLRAIARALEFGLDPKRQ